MSENQIMEAKLSEVCSLVTDGTHDTPKQISNGYPLVKAKEIVGGVIDFCNCSFISEKDHNDVIARSNPEYGDTLFAHIGASLGEAAFINTKKKFSIKNIALFKPNAKIIGGRYLFYLTISPQFQELAKRSRTGSAQPFLSLGHLRSHKINFHKSLATQRKIAGVLSAYDDLIENNTRRIAILEEMAQCIYKEWFVNFKYPGHENDKLVESELGPIPEGWEVKKLGDVVSFHIGGGWGKEEEIDNYLSPAYVIRGTDIPSSRHGNIDNSPFRYHTESNLKSRKLEDGDIVFEVSGGSKGQPLGRALLVNQKLIDSLSEPVICASFCKLIRPDKEKISSEYLYLNFLEIYQNLEITKYQVQSTGISNFKFSIFLEKHMIAKPKNDLIANFTNSVSELFEQIQILGKQNQNLRQTRDLLLPKLISGKVDVSELRIIN